MKNPQNYKKFYKQWNNLKDEIRDSIREILSERTANELGSKTLDLTPAINK